MPGDAGKDQRPPRFALGERETVMRLWAYHRDSFLRKATGVSDADASRRLVGTETTLLWLANHMAATQMGWILNTFADRSEPPLAPASTIAGALEACRKTWMRVDEVIAKSDFDDLCAKPVHGDSELLNLRWVVVHLLEETARHAGHADILRELIDGTTGR